MASILCMSDLTPEWMSCSGNSGHYTKAQFLLYSDRGASSHSLEALSNPHSLLNHPR